MSGVPGGTQATDMHGPSEAQPCRTSRCAAELQEDVAAMPWAALTKGECLLLAQALHRLSRINAHTRSAGEEDRRC